MMLIRWPFHSAVVAAEVIVMPALLLLFHPVHRGSALVDLADLVGAAGVVEDALGRRRLAGVDMRHDPDIACVLKCELAWHRSGSRLVCQSEGRGKKRGPLGPTRAAGLKGLAVGYVLEVCISDICSWRRARTTAEQDSTDYIRALAGSKGCSDD